MAPQKETIMVLKVDLDCPRCYKKVKKLLCQFHQIHDQVYNEKQNTVMIKVLCCSPEKIRDKLCCKGGKSIKSIEILEPKKPPPPPPEKPAPAQPPPPVEKPKEEPSPPPPPPADPNPNPNPPEKLKKNGSKNGSRKNGSPKPEKPPEEAPPPPPPPTKPNNPEPAPEPKPDPPPQKPAEPDPTPVQQADPVQCYPVYQVNPVNMCCPECYAGHTTGPCYHGYGYGYGVPPPPPAGGWGYYGGGYSGYSNNYKPGYCVSRCGDYISDENPTACVIM